MSDFHRSSLVRPHFTIFDLVLATPVHILSMRFSTSSTAGLYQVAGARRVGWGHLIVLQFIRLCSLSWFEESFSFLVEWVKLSRSLSLVR